MLNRIYNFNRTHFVDPTLNKTYAKELQLACPKKVDPRIAINMNPVTPKKFDNIYFKNLQQGKGLFNSDQVLFTDNRTKPFVTVWANDLLAFNRSFVISMRKLGSVGIKTSREGNICRDSLVNSVVLVSKSVMSNIKNKIYIFNSELNDEWKVIKRKRER